MAKCIALYGGDDPNSSGGRIILSINQDDKPFIEIEGVVSMAEAIYMLERAKMELMERDCD